MADEVLRQPVPVEANIFIGIDASLSGTGFCLKVGHEIRVETIKSKPDDAPNDLARLKLIVGEIMRRIPKDTKMVCIEDFFTPGNAAQIGSAIKLAMLGTAIRLALYDAGLPFFVIHPGQLKKWITSSGGAQKSLIIMAVYKAYGIEVKDDNQADAAVLAHIAEALGGIRIELPKYQSEVLDKIRSERPRYNLP